MKSLKEIKAIDFKTAMLKVMDAGHNSVAPLGMSGDRIFLHQKEKEKVSRCQQVSIRLYCGDPELLITNDDGDFLFYGRYDIKLGVDVVAKEYFKIFKLVKKQIPLSFKEETEIKVVDNPHYTLGWAMMGLRR